MSVAETLTLIVGGTLISLGIQEEITVMVLLLYPILAAFLAVAWMHNDIRISEIAEYMRINTESRLSGIHWETHLRQKKSSEAKGLLTRATEISASGVFIFTQSLSLILAVQRLIPRMAEYPKPEMILLALDFVAVVLTIWLIRKRRSQYRSNVKATVVESSSHA